MSRYQTSYEIAKKFSDEFGNDVMLATGTIFPDALTGGVLATKLKTPLLLSDITGVIPEIKEFIRSRFPDNIYVLGGPFVMPEKIIEDIYA